MNCIFCTTYDSAYLSDFGDIKAVPIDSEEIIRRRSIAENYLKENNNAEKDWIETYHDRFVDRFVFTSKKSVPENSFENEHAIQATFPIQNENLLSLKNSDDSKDETVSSNTNRDNSPRNDNDETSNSCIFKEISEANDDMVPKNSEKNHSECSSKSNKLGNFPVICDIFEDNKLDPTVKCFSNVRNNDFRFKEFKNLSIDTDKIIQIMIKNSKLTSRKYFIHGETLTLTEVNKLHEYLSSLSFLQESENNVYSINRMKIIDSIGEVTPLLQQNKFNNENQKQSCKLSNTGNDITTEAFNSENNVKKSTPDFKQCVGHRTKYKEMLTTEEKIHKDLSLLKHEKNILLGNSESSEILHRTKLMNSFINSLNNNQEDWIETYHLNNAKSKSLSENNFNFQAKEKQNNESFKIHSQERLYIIRWINKLQNKFKDPHINYRSFSIQVSADLYEMLEKFSREFDIVMFDELVSSMITNATLYNYANALYFDYQSALNAVYLPLNYPKISIFIILLFCYIFSSNLDYNFALYRVLLAFIKNYKWILLITAVGSSFYLTGYKIYQQKIAEKHSVTSRVVPSYCVSILNQKSGIFAHIEEWFRLYWHDEDCRMYYEALMVDPSSEITFFSISTDLLSDAVLQMLQPLARNMNSFFKALTYNLSFIQQFFIIILTLFIIIFILYFCLSFFAFRSNYKVNFPFHLGSVEPTEFSQGSRVEEIEEKEIPLLKDSSTSCNASQIKFHDKIESKNFIEHVALKEITFKIEPLQFKLDALKISVTKAVRTRHNSI